MTPNAPNWIRLPPDLPKWGMVTGLALWMGRDRCGHWPNEAPLDLTRRHALPIRS